MNDTKTVFDNFRRFTVSVKKERTSAAVDDMLIAIQGYSTANVPVDIGNLANSVFRKLMERGDSWAGVVYYTAKYAPWVHEMSGKLRGRVRTGEGSSGNYWDAYGKQPAKTQFLAKAVEEMIQKDFDRIIRKYY
ncbi:MAG: hypothetical protein ACPHUL_00825 [Marinomonas gallaica]